LTVIKDDENKKRKTLSQKIEEKLNNKYIGNSNNEQKKNENNIQILQPQKKQIDYKMNDEDFENGYDNDNYNNNGNINNVNDIYDPYFDENENKIDLGEIENKLNQSLLKNRMSLNANKNSDFLLNENKSKN
jgi:hypothetical protein